MSVLRRLFLFPLLALGLFSCDSLKEKAKAVLDEKIEDTVAEGEGETAEPGATAKTAKTTQSKETDIDDEITLDSGPAAASAPTSHKRIRNISDADYESFTKISNHVVVVDFYADWCPPCRRLAPELDKIVASHNGKVLLGKYDVDKYKQVAAQKRVSGIPDVRIYVNGKEVQKMTGPSGAAVAKAVQTHLGSIRSTPQKPPVVAQKPPTSKPGAKPGATAANTPAGQQPKEGGQSGPIKKMDKDWLPPGVKRN